MEDIVCKFWEVPCRFCSEESTYCACTYIRKQDGHYIGVKVGYIKSERGQYCNNVGEWVKDIHYCPARWALTSGHDIRGTVVKKRKYVKKMVPAITKRKYQKKATSISKGSKK